ncbi:unnamed protein product [Choristocarpus tenellus]
MNIAKLKTKAEGIVINYMAKSDVEKRLAEALSNKGWATPTSLLNAVAEDTYTFDSYITVMRAIWRTLDGPPRNWKSMCKALELLDHLVKNGTERIISEARDHQHSVQALTRFTYHDGNLDRGTGVREKAANLTQLLGSPELIRSERLKARDLKSKFIGYSATDPQVNERGSYSSSQARRQELERGNGSAGSDFGSDELNYDADDWAAGYDRSPPPSISGDGHRDSVTSGQSDKIDFDTGREEYSSRLSRYKLQEKQKSSKGTRSKERRDGGNTCTEHATTDTANKEGKGEGNQSKGSKQEPQFDLLSGALSHASVDGASGRGAMVGASASLHVDPFTSFQNPNQPWVMSGTGPQVHHGQGYDGADFTPQQNMSGGQAMMQQQMQAQMLSGEALDVAGWQQGWGQVPGVGVPQQQYVQIQQYHQPQIPQQYAQQNPQQLQQQYAQQNPQQLQQQYAQQYSQQLQQYVQQNPQQHQQQYAQPELHNPNQAQSMHQHQPHHHQQYTFPANGTCEGGESVNFVQTQQPQYPLPNQEHPVSHQHQPQLPPPQNQKLAEQQQVLTPHQQEHIHLEEQQMYRSQQQQPQLQGEGNKVTSGGDWFATEIVRAGVGDELEALRSNLRPTGLKGQTMSGSQGNVFSGQGQVTENTRTLSQVQGTIQSDNQHSQRSNPQQRLQNAQAGLRRTGLVPPNPQPEVEGPVGSGAVAGNGTADAVATGSPYPAREWEGRGHIMDTVSGHAKEPVWQGGAAGLKRTGLSDTAVTSQQIGNYRDVGSLNMAGLNLNAR